RSRRARTRESRPRVGDRSRDRRGRAACRRSSRFVGYLSVGRQLANKVQKLIRCELIVKTSDRTPCHDARAAGKNLDVSSPPATCGGEVHPCTRVALELNGFVYLGLWRASREHNVWRRIS